MLVLVDGVVVCVPLVLVISGSPSVCEADSRSLNNTTSQHTLQHRKNIYPPHYQPDITSKQSVWDFLSDETYGTFGGGDEDLISL